MVEKPSLRKCVGYFCSILGFALIVVGLTIYLNGPTEAGTITWERDEGRTYHVDPNMFVSYFYRIDLPEAQSLIPQVEANVAVVAEQGERIKVYFMNETLYFQLKNDTTFSEEIEEWRVESSNFSFQPSYTIAYFVVLTNTANETETVSIEISNVYTILAFDYTVPFDALNPTLVGGVFFAVSFVFGNVFDEFLHSRSKWVIFPGVEEYRGKKEPTIFPIAWAVLGIAALLVSYYVFSSTNEVAASNIPPPIIPLVQDVSIRFSLFLFFAVLLFFVVLIIMDFFHDVLRNSLYWTFGVRYGRLKNKERKDKVIELAAEFQSTLFREMRSYRSIAVYSAIALLSFIIYVQVGDLLILIITALTPFVLLSTYNLSVSLYRTCKEESELDLMRFFVSVDTLTTIFTAPLIILIWFTTWNLSLDGIYSGTVGSSTLVTIAPSISEISLSYLSFILEIIRSISEILPSIALGLVVTLSSFPLIAYVWYPSEIRKGKARVFFKEFSLFFLNFIFIQLIMLMCGKPLFAATLTSIFVSLATSLLKAYTASFWKSVLAKP